MEDKGSSSKINSEELYEISYTISTDIEDNLHQKKTIKKS